jgi:hypothetical protein
MDLFNHRQNLINISSAQRFVHRNMRVIAVISLVLISILSFTSLTFAGTVVDLPADNLMQNAWFRSASNPNKPGLDQWTDPAGLNQLWSTSQKDSNPSPDSVTGTSARFAFGSGQGGGSGVGGVDAYLYQIVKANADAKDLSFQMHWVTGWIEVFSVTIFGGDTAGGPWFEVWHPLHVTSENGSNHAWTQTPALSTTIAKGYPFYRVEVHARYPAESNQGAKFTGVYFSTGGNNPGPTPSPEPTASPGLIFADVPQNHPYQQEIELLYQAGYTSGCGVDPLIFCPEKPMDRAESAVFIGRGLHGAEFTPLEPETRLFFDLPLDSWAAKWAQVLWDAKFTSGCGTDPLTYCPWEGHTRAEGAVFYLRMLNGADYEPDPASGIFSDLPDEHWAAGWAEAAFNAGLIPVCADKPLQFCPDDPLDRGLAAYMMVQAKDLVPGK